MPEINAIDNATLEKLLFKVARPARYTGGEWNITIKDWAQTRLRVALAYPDVYDIGMSNLAIPILYEALNRLPDVLAERVYTPWSDMAALLRENKIPLFSLESKRPLREFDVIGFSLGYELCFTNVLEMLDLAGMPVLSSARDADYPLVIAGGSGALNPEPMADFVDLFVAGDGEEVVTELAAACLRLKGSGASREETLKSLAAIPGVYAPSLYQPVYEADGRFRSISSPAGAPLPVRRRVVNPLPAPTTRPIVPLTEVVHDRAAIEIQRGCTRGCRFCQAGIIYRPVRVRPPAEVIKGAVELVENCGDNELSLLSLSTSDYPGIDVVTRDLSSRFAEQRVALSLPSLHIDGFSLSLLESLADQKKTGLTFAPEAGSQRLRDVINKDVTEAQIIETAVIACDRGWDRLKLYFMLGLPTETDTDIDGIVALVDKVRGLSVRGGSRRLQLSLTISTFVPKPHTPFQWCALESDEVISRRQERLRSGLPRKGIRLSWSDQRVSRLEAALSRGDRRLGQVIHKAWQLGATFDAWVERFQPHIWAKAFAECGFDPNYYTRQRPLDEPLPWQHIESGVDMKYLKREYERALAGQTTGDCREKPCNACGLEDMPGGCPAKKSSARPARKKTASAK